MNSIEIKGLTKRFGARTAVDGLDLTVKEGELFALLGVNGAGKTTTIRMLCCLLPPSGGDALIMGKSIVHDAPAVKALNNISPQETAIAPNLTVRENLAFMAGIYGAGRKESMRLADELAGSFKLEERADDMAKTLSGGMQRRLSIAMALISKPEVLFLDEPTLGLDVRARRDLWTVIESLRTKVTVVLTTHYLEEAQALADRIGIMHEGRLLALGTARELMEQSATQDIEQAFLKITDAAEAEI